MSVAFQSISFIAIKSLLIVSDHSAPLNFAFFWKGTRKIMQASRCRCRSGGCVLNSLYHKNAESLSYIRVGLAAMGKLSSFRSARGLSVELDTAFRILFAFLLVVFRLSDRELFVSYEHGLLRDKITTVTERCRCLAIAETERPACSRLVTWARSSNLTWVPFGIVLSFLCSNETSSCWKGVESCTVDDSHYITKRVIQ